MDLPEGTAAPPMSTPSGMASTSNFALLAAVRDFTGGDGVYGKCPAMRIGVGAQWNVTTRMLLVLPGWPKGTPESTTMVSPASGETSLRHSSLAVITMLS